MKDYIAIIRKLDFVNLFKYGQFSINYAVPFDGCITAHADDTELFDALTCRMDMYEYSFEYVIIHFKAKDYNGQYTSINIMDVCSIYTFDLEAKKEMSVSFDPRIQLNVSPWAEKFNKLHQKLSIKQSMRGVDNLWSIFDLPVEDRLKCENLIGSESVQEAFRELYAYERPSGNLSIWTYLLRYERHSFYPKGMIGIFCDFIHVFCNFSKQIELSGEIAETTQIYPQLMACKSGKLGDLYEIVKTSPLSNITEQVAGCRFALAATLFLYFKALFIEGLEHKPNDEIITYAKEFGGFECSVAVYLLGLSLGYDKTYDAFYESSNLQIFKRKQFTVSQSQVKEDLKIKDNHSSKKPLRCNKETIIAPEKIEVPSQEGSELKGTAPNDNNDKSQCHIEDLFHNDNDDDHDKEQKLPIQWMIKKSKGQKADVRPVFKEEEITELTKLSYERVTIYHKTVKEVILSYGYDPEKEKKRLTNKKKK